MGTAELVMALITALGSSLITAVATITVAVLNGNRQLKILRKQTDEDTEKRIEAFRQGLRALLKDRMYEMHKNVVQNKSRITVQELENFNDMYEQYHILGGNGVMTTIHHHINENTTIIPDDGTF